MNKINESEKKRLDSVKQKKKLFKAKELAVQQALKNLDNQTNNNKIIFDEDIDINEEPKVAKVGTKRKHQLFDDAVDDDDKDESAWDISNFENNKKESNMILGNDARFKIDERFMEDNDAVETDNTPENCDKNDFQKEKEMQLDILGNILNVPIQNTSKHKELNKDPKFAKKQMIRYDPTERDHKEYEIVSENKELDQKIVKKKKKSKNNEIIESTPVEVSKEIYFSVSESLTKTLQKGGEFSVLKTFGKEEIDNKEQQEYKAIALDSSQDKKFHFNFDTKNPFKYDSSDNEEDKEINLKEEQQLEVPKTTSKFFFSTDDLRFNEAVTFFCKRTVPHEEFKDLRRELKQIVRLKIRRNVKNRQPYGYKKKIMRQNPGRKRKH